MTYVAHICDDLEEERSEDGADSTGRERQELEGSEAVA